MNSDRKKLLDPQGVARAGERIGKRIREDIERLLPKNSKGRLGSRKR